MSNNLEGKLMEEADVLLFPLRNEHGFKVDSLENYQHMIHTIIAHTVDLQIKYPEQPIYVIYKVNND